VRRLFWIAVGATAGVLAVRQAHKITRRLPTREPLAGASQAVREFVADVKAGMAERDVELRHALGVSTDGGRASNGDPEAVEALLHPSRMRGQL
jgi:hypothetical protein